MVVKMVALTVDQKEKWVYLLVVLRVAMMVALKVD
jgi:hypothetical protein